MSEFGVDVVVDADDALGEIVMKQGHSESRRHESIRKKTRVKSLQVPGSPLGVRTLSNRLPDNTAQVPHFRKDWASSWLAHSIVVRVIRGVRDSPTVVRVVRWSVRSVVRVVRFVRGSITPEGP